MHYRENRLGSEKDEVPVSLPNDESSFWSALATAYLLCGTSYAAVFTLGVNVNGSGSVIRNPTNSSYPAGVVVVLTATPATNWFFAVPGSPRGSGFQPDGSRGILAWCSWGCDFGTGRRMRPELSGWKPDLPRLPGSSNRTRSRSDGLTLSRASARHCT